MTSERQIALVALTDECSRHYGDEGIRRLPLCLDDHGFGYGWYNMCYPLDDPALEKYCGPDWTFWWWQSAGISSFAQTRDELIREGAKAPVVDKVAWYGNIHTPSPLMMEHETRALMKRMGDENSDKMHIVDTSSTDSSQWIYLPEITRFRFVIDIGGNGYSGRLKYLLFSRRALLLVERPYVEFFHNDLVAWEHYIPVKRDLSDLMERVQWAFDHPEACDTMARAALAFAEERFTHEKLMERIYYVYRNLFFGGL
jgi:hypothetical protein